MAPVKVRIGSQNAINVSVEFKTSVAIPIDGVLELVKQNQLITENTTDPEMVSLRVIHG